MRCLRRVEGRAVDPIRAVLRRDFKIEFLVLLDREDTHRMMIQPQNLIRECHHVHGIEEAVPPRKRKFILRRNVKLALEDCLCRKCRNIRLRDNVHLDAVCHADPTLTDVGVVRCLDRLDVVIIFPIEDFDRLHIVAVTRQIRTDRDRCFALAIDKIIVCDVIKWGFGRRIGHAVCRLLRQSVRNKFKFSLTPYRGGIGSFQKCGDEFMRFLLTVIGGGEIDAVDRTIMLELRRVRKIPYRKSDADLRIRENAANDGDRCSVLLARGNVPTCHLVVK